VSAVIIIIIIIIIPIYNNIHFASNLNALRRDIVPVVKETRPLPYYVNGVLNKAEQTYRV